MGHGMRKGFLIEGKNKNHCGFKAHGALAAPLGIFLKK